MSKIITIDGVQYVMRLTDDGWRMVKNTSNRLPDDTNLAELFNIELDQTTWT